MWLKWAIDRLVLLLFKCVVDMGVSLNVLFHELMVSVIHLQSC